MRISKIILTIWYGVEIKRMPNLTASEIMEVGYGAATYFDELAKAKELQVKVLEEHGFTEEQWKNIMLGSGSFYFTPSAEQDACNRVIKAALKPYLIINAPYYSDEVMTGNLNTLWKKGRVVKVPKIKGNMGHRVNRYTLPLTQLTRVELAIKKQEYLISQRS